MLLRHARKKAGLTQEELGEKLGKYKTYVSKYESGERRLDLIEFIEVSEVLEIEPSDIFSEIRKADYGDF
ncbi:helix-turn-helix domain-containing protein [Microvirga pudoricolor]|uniref:helix-turn-helix domain-containing protein n=1 Tax=Microvirga pudoricolor TaxID=2778729 RepID=UPI001951A583|nr:helix-turn-helix transcriptional regulator [Microvirga pudoricolor]MBM6596606.1 helix-turn-helix transcriptional regulator [Microvirga pudoricolor]